jgi:prepilin-type N-terminal cleavage/methylation domain-containing protein
MVLIRKKDLSDGFTLVEILIAVAIIGLLLVLLLVNWKKQIDRGRDMQRKADLHKIQKAFEEYYNDFNCYPSLTILNNCGSTGKPGDTPAGLSPYLPSIPCDPITKVPYKYVPLDETNLCAGYRILTTLEDYGDQDIVKNGCAPIWGCGWGNYYNWGLAMGGTLTAPGFDPSGPTPTPTPPGGALACSPDQNCRFYEDPGSSGCPRTFAFGSGCKINGVSQCTKPENWCLQ